MGSKVTCYLNPVLAQMKATLADLDMDEFWANRRIPI